MSTFLRLAYCAMFCGGALSGEDVGRWMRGEPRADIRWSVQAESAMLSRMQRLRSRLLIRVDGNEVQRRRGHGRLLMIFAVRETNGKQYENHSILDLRKPPYSSAKNLQYLESVNVALVLPGDYEVTFAMADLETGEHNLTRRKLHVGPLSGDPFDNAWRDVPPVEFEPPEEPPASWFLPSIRSGIAPVVETTRPVRVEVVMNASPSETSHLAQRRTEQSRAMLLPALKALAQMEVPNGALNVSVMDIARRRIMFSQDAVTRLDWPALAAALGEDDPNTIDARALKQRERNVQFFLDEVGRRMASDGKTAAVVIVLSAPMMFPSETDRKPIEADAGADRRLFYIRYQTVLNRIASGDDFSRGVNGRGRSPLPNGPPIISGLPDQLEATLKPLHPRMFEVWTPMDFRKAVAEIVREIAAAR